MLRDSALDIRILPRAPRCRGTFPHSQATHAISEVTSINGIAITQQVFRRRLPRKSFDKLLRCPFGRGTRSHTVETVKKSIATVCRKCCSRTVRHEGDGGLRSFGRYFSTVDLAISIPKSDYERSCRIHRARARLCSRNSSTKTRSTNFRDPQHSCLIKPW